MPKVFCLLLCALILLSNLLVAESELVSARHVQVQLVSEYSAIKPGASQYLAVRFIPEPGWHIYWKYHGDSGLAPKIKWTTSPELTIGSIKWPIPSRIAVAHLMNYGYSQEVLLPQQVAASPGLALGSSVNIAAKVSWLVCKEECIPGSAALTINLPVDNNLVPSASAAKLSRTIDLTPLELDLTAITARKSNDTEIVLEISSSKSITLPKSGVVFIPDGPGQIDNASPQPLAETQNGLALLLKKPKNTGLPSNLSGIVISNSGWTENTLQAIEFSTPVEGVVAQQNALELEKEAVLPVDQSILTTIFFAFLGGIILNLMPCVFPILSIKILGFVQQGQSSNSNAIKHSLSFAAGVLASFWALAALLLTLRSGGQAIGWGFQLQSPTFVLTMIFLTFLISLNLLGTFEFGATLQNLAGKQAPHTGHSASFMSASFMSGVLATALATPCTAPFMASALAVALSQSNLVAFMIFTALAIGMALPYVIISTNPKLIQLLPKPGMWMVKLKEFLAFPMLATTIWLISVYSKQTQTSSVVFIMFSLLIFGLAIWLWNSFANTLIKYVFAPIAVISAIFMSFTFNTPNVEVTWEEFSADQLQKLVAENKPVFIDFTAEWCLTCKVNKYTVLTNSSVLNEFKTRKIILMRADWTNQDENITKAIESFGRSGVPLNVLYYGNNKEPYVFPTLLTRNMVIKQLEKVIQKQ